MRHELSSRYPWVQRYVHQSEICVSQLKPQNRKPLFVLPLHSLPRAASRGKCCASFGCSRTTWEAVFLLGNSKQPYTTRTFYGLKTVLDSSWWPLNPAEIFASKSFSRCYNQPRVQVLFSSTRNVWLLALTPFRCLWENITTDTSSLALAFRARIAAK